MKYKAFISYSHAADGKLAPAFQFALHRFARPWFRVRAMRVFRDKTSLSATPALWPSIEAALGQSEFFLLLASPDAASSSWVEKEVKWWLTNRPHNRLFIVLTEGAIAWNGEERDFDWKKTTALPCCLKGKFSEEPLHVDLTWARHEEQLSLRHSRFRAAVLDIAAPLHGREKEDLDGEDVRENRRTLRLETTDGAMTYRVGGHFSIAALSLDGRLLATGAPGGDLRLWDVVTGREIERYEVLLAIQAVQFSPDGRLIVASFRRRPGESVDIACLYVIDLRSGRHLGPIDLGGSEGLFEEFALSPSGEIAFTWFEKGGYALWRVRGESTIRTPLSPMPHQAAGQEKNEPEPDLREIRFSEDGRRALVFSPHGWIWVWDVATADLIFTSDGFPDLDPDVGPWLEDVLLTEDGHLLARWGGGDLYTARLEDPEAERKLNIQAGPPEGCRGFFGTIFPAPTPGIFFHAGERLSLHRIEDCSEIIAADAESRRFFAKSEAPLRIMLGTEGGMVLAVDRAAKMLEWKDRLPQILARLQADANDAEALAEIGAWYAFRSLWEQALSAFRRAELAGSKSIPALDRARAHWQAGRIEEAEEGFLSLVAREGPEAVYASVCLRALQRLRETEY